MRPRAIALVAARDAGQAFGSRWFVLASGCFLVLSLGLSMLGLAGLARRDERDRSRPHRSSLPAGNAITRLA